MAKTAVFDAGEVFSGKTSGTQVIGYDAPSEYTPKVDPDYMFNDSAIDIIMWLISTEFQPLYVFGPQGAGKTSCIKQLAAKLNYPVYELNGQNHLEFADLVGHLTVKDGNMSFVYGPLALAMKYGGLFLLNEIDVTPPEICAGLNTILDGSALCIPENNGELIQPHPMFRFAVTANTNGGCGDDTGLYLGTNRLNGAFLDRFMMVEVGYPEAATEAALVHRKCPKLAKDLADKMVSYANEVRKLFTSESNAIDVTFSTRSLLRWADLTLRYQPLARQGKQPLLYALDRALGFRASRETRATLYELAQRLFPGLKPVEA